MSSLMSGTMSRWVHVVNTFPTLDSRHGYVNVWTTRTHTVFGGCMTPHELLLLSRARRYAESGEGRELRLAAGLSLREVAEGHNIAPHTLWKWERGERVPRAPGAIAWAAFLNELSRQSA